jgi:hypothetical protein
MHLLVGGSLPERDRRRQLTRSPSDGAIAPVIRMVISRCDKMSITRRAQVECHMSVTPRTRRHRPEVCDPMYIYMAEGTRGFDDGFDHENFKISRQIRQFLL